MGKTIDERVIQKPEGSPDFIIKIVSSTSIPADTIMTIGTGADSEHPYADLAQEFLNKVRDRARQNLARLLEVS